MKIKPLSDRVLILRDELKEKTAGGLYIPETAQKKTQDGVVIAIGTSIEEINVEVGDRIMYDKYAGTIVSSEGIEYLLVKAIDILAILN